MASTRRRSTATGVWRASSDWMPSSIAEVALVDLVVEGDHLVGELDVLDCERVQAAAERAEDELAFLLERRLELVELLLQGDPHPNRPVT